jgi:hypothetical protein
MQLSSALLISVHEGHCKPRSAVQTSPPESPHFKKVSRSMLHCGYLRRVIVQSDVQLPGTPLGQIMLATEQNMAHIGSSGGAAPPVPSPTPPAPPVPNVAPPVPVITSEVVVVRIPPAPVALEVTANDVLDALEVVLDAGSPVPVVPLAVAAPPEPESPDVTLPPHAITSPATMSQVFLMERTSPTKEHTAAPPSAHEHRSTC